MSARRIFAAVAMLAIILFALWLPDHAHRAALQNIVDQADRDTAAAKAAAASAAQSAARAKASAQNSQNRLPGSS